MTFLVQPTNRVQADVSPRNSTWTIIRCCAAAVLSLLDCANACAAPPNIVVIIADDLGYGDLGCYGHPTIRTPQLDRMAAEGLRFTQFYSAAEVCTPSRAALLTGRLPIRSGMCSHKPRVLYPTSQSGLPADEVTLAELVKSGGYDTTCIGKWHLGQLPEFLPIRHGFDHYFGLPYSNDMDRVSTSPQGRLAYNDSRSEYWNVPLIRDEDIVERPADQATLTRRYTDEAVTFIERHHAADAKPFFLYLAHTMPHTPLFRTPEFANASRRGLYGDVVEELDANVGRVLESLRSTGLAANTLVWFTSDNGPWLTQGLQGGSAGLLRDGKGSTWEGGLRVPGIAWWPGTIQPNVTRELASTLDLLPTACGLAEIPLPTGRLLDGYDLSPLLKRGEPSPRHEMYYYRGPDLFAVRRGSWKAHLFTQPGYGTPERQAHDPPALYQLDEDPSESFDVARDHPEVLTELTELIAKHRATLTPAPSRLEPAGTASAK